MPICLSVQLYQNSDIPRKRLLAKIIVGRLTGSSAENPTQSRPATYILSPGANGQWLPDRWIYISGTDERERERERERDLEISDKDWSRRVSDNFCFRVTASAAGVAAFQFHRPFSAHFDLFQLTGSQIQFGKLYPSESAILYGVRYHCFIIYIYIYMNASKRLCFNFRWNPHYVPCGCWTLVFRFCRLIAEDLLNTNTNNGEGTV